MKKILLCFLLLILITGCKDKNIVCKGSINNKTENYKLNSEYKIYYKGNYVVKIEKEDIYSSKIKEEMDYLEEINTLNLDNKKSIYGSYDYNIEKKDYKLKVNTEIIIKDLDIKQMILDDIISRDYVVGNRIVKSGVIDYYESKGLKCDI